MFTPMFAISSVAGGWTWTVRRQWLRRGWEGNISYFKCMWYMNYTVGASRSFLACITPSISLPLHHSVCIWQTERKRECSLPPGCVIICFTVSHVDSDAANELRFNRGKKNVRERWREGGWGCVYLGGRGDGCEGWRCREGEEHCFHWWAVAATVDETGWICCF